MSEASPPAPSRAGALALAVVPVAAFLVAAVLSAARLPDGFRFKDQQAFMHWTRATFEHGDGALDASVMNPVQGLAGLSQPIAARLHPGYQLARHAPFDVDPLVAAHWGVLVPFFFATWALARAAGLGPTLALVAAQLLTAGSFPMTAAVTNGLGIHNVGLLYTTIPGCAVPTLCGSATLALLLRLGRCGSPAANAACAAGLALVPLYAVVVDPLYAAVLCLPAAVVGVGVLAGSPTWDVARWRLGGAALAALVLVVTGALGSLRALFGYAARARFPDELYVEVQRWDDLTSLGTQSPAWLVLTLLHLAGLAWLARRGADRQERGLAAGAFAVLAGLQVVSVLYVKAGWRWHLPLPAYVDLGAQPVYLVTALLIARRLHEAHGARSAALVRLGHVLAARAALSTWLARLIVPALVLLVAGSFVARSPSTPPARGAITDILVRELQLRPGAPFRGSVATVVCVPGQPAATALGWPADEGYGKKHLEMEEDVLASLDPSLRHVALWDLDVPTFEDDNHLVTPPFHFLISRGLSRPQDYHSRNWTTMTRIRPRLLATLGVRFVITDQVVDDPRIEPCVDLRGTWTTPPPVAVPLRLYELRGVNAGQRSPVRLHVELDARRAVARLIDDGFDLEAEALVHDPADAVGPLVPAEGATLSFERGGARVRARSAGRSLVLLPLQFSNSLQVTVIRGAAPRLVRADLLLTGLVFEGEVEVRLRHVFGPFRGSAGRRRDIEDCARLGIQQTGEVPYPPGYQPEAW